MKGINAGILVCSALLISACGIKGPLYLPNVPKDAPWPYKTDKPNPAASPAPSSSTPAAPAPTDGTGTATPAAPAPDSK